MILDSRHVSLDSRLGTLDSRLSTVTQTLLQEVISLPRSNLNYLKKNWINFKLREKPLDFFMSCCSFVVVKLIISRILCSFQQKEFFSDGPKGFECIFLTFVHAAETAN